MTTLMRFTSTGPSWSLAVISGAITHTGPLSGGSGPMPAWLESIITVARIGGHLWETDRPPPEHIVWFRVDDDKQLIEFVDME